MSFYTEQTVPVMAQCRVAMQTKRFNATGLGLQSPKGKQNKQHRIAQVLLVKLNNTTADKVKNI